MRRINPTTFTLPVGGSVLSQPGVPVVHVINPPAPCVACGGNRFFALPEGMTWTCASCHPPGDPRIMVWHEVPLMTRG